MGLIAIALALGLASLRLRARFLPGWSGPPARLAEAVIALSLLTVLLQLLGTAGQLDYLPLVAAAVLVGLALAVWATREGAGGDAGSALYGPSSAEATEVASARRRDENASPAAPDVPAAPTWLPWAAIAITVLVAAHWATGVQASWANGMSGFDTMWYHGPFAGRFAQEGSITALHFTDPEYLHWFYPENSEVLHAAGIVLFDHDLLSPLINLGWLGLALLAAWCIGRPYGVAPLSMLGAALVLETNTMVPREAGNAANDIAVVALLLAAAAILLTAEKRNPYALALSGLAAGLALGTKLTVAAAVLALTVGVIWLAKGQRGRTALIWLASVAATGGYWFVRNMFHAGGNPAPWLSDSFPFLPGPERGLEGRDPFSVSHYFFDGDVIGTYFLPGLHGVLGPLWPLLLALAAGGMACALLRGRTPTIRMLGAVAAVAAIAYLFTPLTASGPEGQPDGFAINLRYLAAALALGVALLPLDHAFAARDRAIAAFAVLAIAIASVALYSDAKIAWQDDDAFVPAALAIGLAVIAAPVAIALIARTRAALAAGAAAALAVLVLAVGWWQQDDYIDSRYEGEFRFHLESAFRLANEVSGQRIGVGGTSGAFQQYGLYGGDVSNEVQYVGRPGADGDFTEITSCPEWRSAVNDGNYNLLVTTPRLDLNDAARATPSPEGSWAAGDPAATRIARDGQVEVFRIEGDLDPDACPTT